MVQSFCEDVCSHVLSSHKCWCNKTFLHPIPEPKQAKREVLHLAMVFRVLVHSNGRLVVHSQHRWARHLVTKLPHNLAHLQDLFSGLNSRNVFRFSGGKSNQCLKL